jgi:hypothetical protein
MWLMRMAKILAGIAAAFFLFWFGPADAQINLMTGDLRYRKWWIPYEFVRLRAPYSEWLKPISSGNDRWVTVATFPLPTTNNSQAMCQSFYAEAVAWSRFDAEIGKALLRDVEEYIVATNATSGLPKAIWLLWYVERDGKGHVRLREGWESHPPAQDFLQKRDLKPNIVRTEDGP